MLSSQLSRITTLHFRYFSSSNEPLIVERLKGKDEGIVVFGLNRGKVKNALNKELLDRLEDETQIISEDSKARVLILKSCVPGAFSAGADLKERRSMPSNEVGPFVRRLRLFADKLSFLPIPTIAAIDGVALGGGLEFALACDMRVASISSKLGLTETRLAIFPAAGGCQRLPRLIGGAKAKELIFTGRILDGIEAERLGIVNVAVENSEEEPAYHKALEMAREIVCRGPVAVRMAKLVMDTALRADGHVSNYMEEQAYERIIVTKDRVEGLAAFNEKRTPIYKGE